MATFDQFMAESGRQAELDQIRSIPGEYERAKATWESQGGFYGPGGRAATAEDAAQQLIDAQLEVFDKTFGEAFRKLEKFDKDNPFVFDQELARASAEERYDPFYDAELRDFMTGVERQRGRTVQDEERLRRELTASTESYVGRARRELDQALESSREGFAGAGLYFSGKRLRREGEIGIEAEQEKGDYLRRQGLRGEESTLRQERGLADIATGEATYKRRFGAEKETTFLTDIAQQRREQLQQRELERQQIAGPFYGGGGASMNSIFGL